MEKPTLPHIVGHMPDGEPIYSLPEIPEPIKGCASNPEFPCLPCILNELVPILTKLNGSMERNYTQLIQLQEIRIDSNVTELHVQSVSEQLRMQLAFASTAHNTLSALLETAKTSLA